MKTAHERDACCLVKFVNLQAEGGKCNCKKYDEMMMMMADPSGRAKAWVCGRALAGIVGSNPTGAWMFVLYSVCVSRRGLCDGPIPRPEEAYRLWCVSECDQVKLKNLDTYCE
jgi:hypothetical protein